MSTAELPRLTETAACSLDAGAAARRAADFRALLAPRVRRVVRDGARAAIDLELGARAERELRDLLDAERECCPFWDVALTRRSSRRARLEVRARAPFEDALDAFMSVLGDRAPEAPAYRAGEAARRAGVGVETLRYYERRGLLPAPRRRPSGQREYTPEDVRLVVAIKAAQRLGFTLAETREIVRVTRRRRPGDPPPLHDRVEAKLREVDDRIRGLELMRAELRAVQAAECDALIDCGCGDCPIEDAAPR
jgi:DNA-binding transcriptional MerR regulator